MVEDDLGYTNVTKMRYCGLRGTGYNYIYDDSGIMQMLEVAKVSNGGIKVYSEHEVVAEVNAGSAVTRAVEEVELEDGEAEEIDTQIQSDAYAAYYSDSGSDDFTLEDLPELDDDDEELVLVKKMVEERKRRRRLQYTDDEAVSGNGGSDPMAGVCDKEAVSGIDEVVNEDTVNEDTGVVGNGIEDTGVVGGDHDIDSEYAESSDEDSPDTDDEQCLRKKSKFPTFNADVDVFHVRPVLGMMFANPNQLKDCVKDFAVTHGYQIWFQLNSQKRILVVCAEGCPFRLYASWMKTKRTFQIKSYIEEHTCTRIFDVKIANCKWIARIYKYKILKYPKIKLADLKEHISHKYKLDVTISQCHRAKRKVLEQVEQQLAGVYAKLRDYAAELRRTNPGSSILIDCVRPKPGEPPVFKSMYICFDSLKTAWKRSCRPVIGVDGCFLKGYCKGELLAAIGRDGNNQMFPIAWAVVEVENTETWRWFMNLLMEDLGYSQGQGLGLTIISDQQKGLVKGIKDSLPFAEHRCCARHIYANFKKSFPGVQYKFLFWKASRCGTPQEFENIMDELKLYSVAAYEHLTVKQDPKQWSRAFFNTFSCSDAVENNICETFNSTILEARGKNIIEMLEDIRLQVMARMQKKITEMHNWTGKLCPIIQKKLEVNKLDHRFWKADYNGYNSFEVRKNTYEGYTVDGDGMRCTCRMWELSGIPCPHAISVMYYKNIDPQDYVASWFTVAEYKQTYSHVLQPINGQNMWIKTRLEAIMPPIARRMPGRPKKNRRKEGSQSTHGRGSHQISRIGRKMHCSRCNSDEHNIKTCKSTDPPLRPKQVKKRKSDVNVEAGNASNAEDVNISNAEDLNAQPNTGCTGSGGRKLGVRRGGIGRGRGGIGRGRLSRGGMGRGPREAIPLGFGTASASGGISLDDVPNLPTPTPIAIQRTNYVSMGGGVHIVPPDGRNYFHPKERSTQMRISQGTEASSKASSQGSTAASLSAQCSSAPLQTQGSIAAPSTQGCYAALTDNTGRTLGGKRAAPAPMYSIPAANTRSKVGGVKTRSQVNK